MLLTVPDKRVKYRNPPLNRSREIRPKAVECGVFGRFSIFDKCRPEVPGDVISDMSMGPTVADKRVKSGSPGTSSSRQMPLEAVAGGIFDSFFTITFDRK